MPARAKKSRKRARKLASQPACQHEDSLLHSDQPQPQAALCSEVQEVQVQHEALLQLSGVQLPVQHRRLVGLQPAPQLSSAWMLPDPELVMVNLIGDAAQPETVNRIEQGRLIAHSQWGAARSRHSEMLNGGVNAVVPVRTSHAVVHKLAKALHSGFVQLGDDIEELLVLANSMQVTSLLLYML